MNDSELARNYILDRLPDEERDACERRFLFDPEFEALMLDEERALLDDYVNLRLSEEDARTVLHRVAQEPGQLYRLRFAEGLKRAAASAAAAGPRKTPLLQRCGALFGQRQLIWFSGVAGAAALTAAVFIAVSIGHRVQQPAPGQVAGTNSRSSAPAANPPSEPPIQPAKPTAPKASGAVREAASIATFVLLANQQRGDAEAPVLTLNPETTTLRLQLTTEEGLDSGTYSAAVTGPKSTGTFAESHLALRTEAGRGYIDLRVPAQTLTSGLYSVDLTQDSGSATKPVLRFRFTLQR